MGSHAVTSLLHQTTLIVNYLPKRRSSNRNFELIQFNCAMTNAEIFSHEPNVILNAFFVQNTESTEKNFNFANPAKKNSFWIFIQFFSVSIPSFKYILWDSWNIFIWISISYEYHRHVEKLVTVHETNILFSYERKII